MQASGTVDAVGTFSLKNLDTAASHLLNKAKNYKVWLFYGEMGAGKTTLIKTICHLLKVKDVMSSPTFSIVNEYKSGADNSIYHFDFYRIKNELEAYDIGTDEYFNSGAFCFVEWPERVSSILPGRHASIYISMVSETERTISIELHG